MKLDLTRRVISRRRPKNRFEPAPSRTSKFELPRLECEGRHAGKKHFVVLGNCQARAFATALQTLCTNANFTAAELTTEALRRLVAGDRRLIQTLSEYDGILAQHPAILVKDFSELAGKVRRIPIIGFSAYHPDLVYVNTARKGDPRYLFGPLGQYNSAIALWAYLRGMSAVETFSLFNTTNYEALGYFDFWRASRQGMLHEGEAAGMLLQAPIDRWVRRGCFMYSVNHPKIHVFSDLAQTLLQQLELPFVPEAAQYTVDEFADGPVWPIYPEIAQRLGIDGDYRFKIEKGRAPPGHPVVMLDLRDFIEGSFDAFSSCHRDQLSCNRLQSDRFNELIPRKLPRVSSENTSTARSSRVRRTPYTDLPRHQFWKGSVAMVPSQEVDPVVSSPFQVSKQTKIATAGSCFAQNISATLRRRGFNYYVPEWGEGLVPEDARHRQFGVYSARYGNIYTARQLLQLFLRAYGRFAPVDTIWQRPDGRFVDPFRPLIDPDGWDSAFSIGLDMWCHLARVREMFENLEVFIFTLGLTEAWRSKRDGAVFPIAPGVAVEGLDESQYEFVNFEVADVVADLQQFLELLRSVNPKAKVILTVSPVPLIATYEPQHALVATTYSKSVLRAAAGEICARNASCAYFPSYEVITGNYARGAYYDSDLRTVTPAGVEHVMRLFLKHYTREEDLEDVDSTLLNELNSVKEIICDERAIESQ